QTQKSPCGRGPHATLWNLRDLEGSLEARGRSSVAGSDAMNGQTHRKRSGTTGAGTSARRLLPPIFVLLLLLSTAIPTARIVVARLKQLAQDARSASFVARVTDEVVNTEDLDLAVGANPRLSRNEALSQILEQKILVEIGRQGGFDVRASLPA